MIEAFITNHGKYNEGELRGGYLKFPATSQEVKNLLSRIGVDGVSYEETFITDYDTEIPGLKSCLGEYENIDELNYLAALLSEMDTADIEKFKSALAYGEYTSSAKDLINLAQNLDCYDYLPGINDYEELGIYYAEECGTLPVPDYLKDYVDYEAYGRDVSFECDGSFTKSGYIVRNDEYFTEHYQGREDIPDEYRIFAFPDLPEKTPVKQQLEYYGRMALSQPLKDSPALARAERG